MTPGRPFDSYLFHAAGVKIPSRKREWLRFHDSYLIGADTWSNLGQVLDQLRENYVQYGSHNQAYRESRQPWESIITGLIQFYPEGLRPTVFLAGIVWTFENHTQAVTAEYNLYDIESKLGPFSEITLMVNDTEITKLDDGNLAGARRVGHRRRRCTP